MLDTMLDARDRNINSILVKVYTKLAMHVAMYVGKDHITCITKEHY